MAKDTSLVDLLITNVGRYIVQVQGEMDSEDKLVTVGQYYEIAYICNSYKNAVLAKGNLTLQLTEKKMKCCEYSHRFTNHFIFYFVMGLISYSYITLDRKGLLVINILAYWAHKKN